MCCYVVGNYGFYDFQQAKQTELNLTSLNYVWYTTFLCTKCNVCVVITLTLSIVCEKGCVQCECEIDITVQEA
jgi:hypothetical protein